MFAQLTNLLIVSLNLFRRLTINNYETRLVSLTGPHSCGGVLDQQVNQP